MSESTSGYLTPDEITSAAFETKRRGFDPEEVKRHLASVAATVHGLAAERNSLAEQVASLHAQLDAATAAPTPQAELDEDALTERLGQDAARVLAEARSAAADRIAEAESQADDIRAAAEELHAQRSAEADEEANRIRESAESVVREKNAEAEQAAAQIIARAEADAESIRSAVVSERQSADADGARIVREAELTRRQILEDLARRRSSARRQIEQLRAGRERLLASHETVRRALDDISEELTISMSEARAAAETAGHSVSDTTIEELEAEIETARLTGLLDTGPVPVVSAPFDHAVESPEVHEPSPAAEPDRTSPEAPGPSDSAAEARVVDEPANETPVEEATAETPADDDAAAVADTSAVDEAAPVAEPVDEAAETTEPSPTTGAGLAEVVQLDRARNDVDTATHPATGRDASSNRTPAKSSSGSKPSEVDGAPAEKAKGPILEAVANPTDEIDEPEPDASTDEPTDSDDDTVGDLFKSLRSTTTAPASKASASKKKASSSASGPKKSTSKSSKKTKASAKSKADTAETTQVSDDTATAADAPDTAVESHPDAAEMARRLKRVLADEQSRAMSRLKSASEALSLDELLGDEAAHCDGYWGEVMSQIDNVSESDEQLKRPVDELVESIRRRVGDALTDAGDDTEGAVASLRSVYREVKTQRISICADEVCRMATGRTADRS